MQTVFANSSLLKINVGFIINQAIGFSRDISLDIPKLTFLEDLTIQDLEGKIVISRTTEGLLVQVKGHAKTDLECVYCLDSFKHILQLDFVEMYVFSSHVVDDSELILPDDLQIDLGPLIREYLFLDIPINPVCKSDCQGLCSICGEKVDIAKCDHGDESIDPRFSALKSLLDNETSIEG